jgi:hypothetical protein
VTSAPRREGGAISDDAMAGEVRQHRAEGVVGQLGAEDRVDDQHDEIDERREQRAERADRGFGPCRTQRRHEEQRAGEHQPAAPTEAVRHDAAQGAADDATEEGAGDGPAAETQRRAFRQPERYDEVLLDRVRRARDDGRVVTEQQTAESGDQREGDDQRAFVFGT